MFLKKEIFSRSQSVLSLLFNIGNKIYLRPIQAQSSSLRASWRCCPQFVLYYSQKAWTAVALLLPPSSSYLKTLSSLLGGIFTSAGYQVLFRIPRINI